MLFDEVTSALDTLRLHGEEGKTMLVVTHEIGFACDVSDRVTFVRDGVIGEIAPPSKVLQNPQSEHTAQFLSNVR